MPAFSHLLLSTAIMSTALLTLSSTSPSHLMAAALAQTLTLTLFFLLSLPDPWLSFMLVLIFFGGILVLFMYVVSQSPTYSGLNLTLLLLPYTSLMDVTILLTMTWAPTHHSSFPTTTTTYLHPYSAATLASVLFLLYGLYLSVHISTPWLGSMRASGY